VEELGQLSQKLRRDMVDALVTGRDGFEEIKKTFETGNWKLET